MAGAPQFFQHLERASRRDYFARRRDSISQRFGLAAEVNRSAAVQRDDILRRPLAAIERGPQHPYRIVEIIYRAQGFFPGRELYFLDPSGNMLELRDPTWQAGMPTPTYEEIAQS